MFRRFIYYSENPILGKKYFCYSKWLNLSRFNFSENGRNFGERSEKFQIL